jgi:two-component system phosphate regulon sensor histidine kinase PhoR
MPAPIVLFLDPNREFLPELEQILVHDRGYQIRTPDSVAAALAELNQTVPRAAVIAMPNGRDAVDAVTRLRIARPDLPVILLLQSAADVYQDVLRVRADEVFIAPIRRGELLAALERHITPGSTSPIHVRVRELETLARLGTSINRHLELDQVLTSIVDAAVRLTGAEEGSLMLLDQPSGELYIRAARNFDEQFVHTFRLKVEDSLAGEVIRTGKPILLDANSPKKIKTSFLVYSLVFVPLMQEGRAVGLLGVDNRSAGRPLTDGDLSLMQALAEYAVIALENARLYEATQSHLRQLETILQGVEDGVLITDPEGNLILANRAARTLFALGDLPLAGQSFQDAVLNSDLQFVFSRRNADDPRLRRTEIVMADERIFNAGVTPIAGVGFAIILHDITHLKEMDRLKSEFVSAVSHDLRSPLTTILGYVDLIERAGPVTAQQKEFISRIQGSVGSITTLITDLLDLGKIESGIDLHKEPVQIAVQARSALESIRARAEQKRIQMAVTLQEGLPPLSGNPTRLRQMVFNLLDNAVKYTPNRGTIALSCQMEEGQILLRVSDTGIGIPLSEVPQVFNKFYRATNVQNTVGTGLGLSIVKSIVDIHNGRMWVDSILGQGTTFTIVLPVPKE